MTIGNWLLTIDKALPMPNTQLPIVTLEEPRDCASPSLETL
jgi:hypothetical protein